MSLFRSVRIATGTLRIFTRATFVSYAKGQSFSYSTMKALVYNGINRLEVTDKPKPKLVNATDAIIKLTKTTICGTDLHIGKGDVATCAPGTTLGHEGVGIVDETGTAVTAFKKGDKVLISCISSCGNCANCRRQMPSHCTTGGWILGNTIDGTQAEYVRIPHADSSLYNVPPGGDEASYLMLSDIFPTGFECGVLRGNVSPGSTVCIVGGGPVGIAAMITAQLYSPSLIIMVDTDEHRLKVAKKLGAQHTFNPNDGDVQAKVRALTEGKGCDTVIEAVGVPATFHQCQELIAPGGIIANVGVHGGKVDLHLEKLWDQNISITTQLVDAVTTPMLLKLLKAGKINPSALITHKSSFSDIEGAYDIFRSASKNEALKVLIEM